MINSLFWRSKSTALDFWKLEAQGKVEGEHRDMVKKSDHYAGTFTLQAVEGPKNLAQSQMASRWQLKFERCKGAKRKRSSQRLDHWYEHKKFEDYLMGACIAIGAEAGATQQLIMRYFFHPQGDKSMKTKGREIKLNWCCCLLLLNLIIVNIEEGLLWFIINLHINNIEIR